MALNNGTRLIAGVVPTDSLDTFATHFSEYGKGGHRTVSGMTELYAITEDRREIGMTVYVSSLLLTYQLVGGISNSDWVIYNSGGGNFTGGTVSGDTNFTAKIYSGGTELSQVIKNISGNGSFLPLSGGTVSGDTNFISNLTANTSNFSNVNILDSTYKTALNSPIGNVIQLGSGFTTVYLPTNIGLEAKSGTDVAGDSYTISSGAGRGAGAESLIKFATPTRLASGSTGQTVGIRMQVGSWVGNLGPGFCAVYLGNGEATGANYSLLYSSSALIINHTSLLEFKLGAYGLPMFTVGGSTVMFGGRSENYIGITVKAHATQAVDLTRWTNSSNTILGKVDKDGNATFPTITANSVNASSIPSIIRGFGAAGSYTQTSDLTQWIKYDGITGTTVSKIDKDGNASFPKANFNILNLTNHTPSSINDGDIWLDGSNLKVQISGVIKTINLT